MAFHYLLVSQLLIHGSINVFALFELCTHRVSSFSQAHLSQSTFPVLIAHKLPEFFPDHEHYHKFKRINIKIRTNQQAEPQQGIDSYEYYN